jgi:hypothetical protein
MPSLHRRKGERMDRKAERIEELRKDKEDETTTEKDRKNVKRINSILVLQ